jgi:hypothetical protein
VFFTNKDLTARVSKLPIALFIAQFLGDPHDSLLPPLLVFFTNKDLTARVSNYPPPFL